MNSASNRYPSQDVNVNVNVGCFSYVCSVCACVHVLNELHNIHIKNGNRYKLTSES